MAEAVVIEAEALIEALEHLRRAEGAGEHAWRITVGQRIDVQRVVAALRGPGGKAREGAAIDVWLDYLAPVLAESGPAKRQLREALSSFLPRDVPPPPNVWTRLVTAVRGRLGLPKPRPMGRLGWVAIALGLVGIVLWSRLPTSPTSSPDAPSARASNQVARNPASTAGLDTRTAAEYDAALRVSLRLLPSGAAVTPRRLAAIHAADDPGLGTPDLVLAAMLRGWPVPPDAALTADARGVATFKRLTAEAATLRSGLPRILFEPRITQTQEPVATQLASAEATTTPSPSRWSRAWLALAALPLLAVLVEFRLRARRREAALLERWVAEERRNLRGPDVPEGIRRSAAVLDTPLPEPVVTRESLRDLTRRLPVKGRRLDARRSVLGVLRQEGYADPVMRRVQRAVHYLIIVQRAQSHDHERLRVRRFVESVAAMGVPVTVYDYDRDPLVVKRPVAAEGEGTREETLTLSALRDLHPDSRLILVTDGSDLVDRITGRVRESIRRGLDFWPERMVLTPVPVGDWGEIEFALSRDLDLPLGRTTQDALKDLERGFRSHRGEAPHRHTLARALRVSGAERLDLWTTVTAAEFKFAGPPPRRGLHLTADDVSLTTDIEPSPAMAAEVVDDLRRWLGARGFLWHAACAIYPQLRFDLTAHIGRSLRAGPHRESPPVFRDVAGDRRTFERLTGLPWYRTGRMPRWLRRECLRAIRPDERERAAQVIENLFVPKPRGRQSPLAIWWPQAGALAMPPDAVMAAALAGDVTLAALELPQARLVALRYAARRAVRRRDATALGLVASACAALAWLAPDFGASPHPSGAWFPFLTFLSACLATAGFCLVVGRRWPFRPDLPRSAEAAAPGRAA